MGELIAILAIVILLFGAKKLPKLGESLGSSIKNFKKGLNEGETKDSDDQDKIS